MLVWRVVKGLPWRRPGNSQPSCASQRSEAGKCPLLVGPGKLAESTTSAAPEPGKGSADRDLIDPTIAVHNGRIVKRTGDGVLIELEASSMPFAAQSRCRMA